MKEDGDLTPTSTLLDDTEAQYVTLFDNFSKEVLNQQGWELTILMLCSRFGKAKVRKDYNYILDCVRNSDDRFNCSHKLIWPKCLYWKAMVSKAYWYGSVKNKY